jgi:hypothetical protein
MEKDGERKFNDRAPNVNASLKQKPISSKSNSIDRCGFEGKSIDESTAKPRSLLPSFLQDNGKNPGLSDVAAVGSNPTSSKKVRWRKDYGDSGDLENVVYETQTAVEIMVKGSAKRKSFGLNGLGGRNELRASAGNAGLSTSKKDTTKDRVGDKRSHSRKDLFSELPPKSDSKRRRVASVDRSNDAFGIRSGNVKILKPAALSKNLNREGAVIKAEQRSSHKLHSNYEEPIVMVKRSTIGEHEGNIFETTNSNQGNLKKLSFSSEWNESKTQKDRVSSAQFSGISSQERPSKGRRRKRVISGASVGSKPSRTNFAEEDYNFNFTN